ncbi:nitrate- and nitrite sensing domain-containing protein [Atlantibacter sp.]|uniref:nitrate- and nitrite sensing domain-containing protein n=1 Tax=Atlantibacter sp. TaxID=1903473 RepID=UPI0028A6A142|nr:nitrate- and nitrite sensing domain-containing protein [Atlantibacter sp.]
MNQQAPRPQSALEWFRYTRRQQQQQLQHLARLGEFATLISQLVHALQRERGASNVWLCSRGALFGTQLQHSAQQVDDALAAFQRWLAEHHALMNGNAAAKLACALWFLEGLSALREEILAARITPEQAMDRFIRTVQPLMEIIPEANDTLSDPQVAQALTALYSLMQGKEWVGQERAVGAIGFTRGEFDAALRQMLVDRIDAQQHSFSTFLSLAGPSKAATFRETAEATRDIEQMRREACTRIPANPHSAARWFALQTERLDALRLIETRLIDTLSAAAQLSLQHTLDDSHTSETALAAWVVQQSSARVAPVERHLLPLVRQQARELEKLSRELTSLQETLEERKTIDKAKSLLMSHQGISEELAWQQLRKLAMNQNQRMVDIARSLLLSASLWQLTPKR